MRANQITLPFVGKGKPRPNPNADLLNRSYTDRDATITVIRLCPDNRGRVMVRRDLDGRTWSMPAWLMRLILMEEKRSEMTFPQAKPF